MQGFIIKTTKVKSEDLLVTLITEEGIKTLYRFYGIRHSTINLGFKIDFEEESSHKVSISRLKGVIQLGFNWILDRDKLLAWQNFISYFTNYLSKDEIDTDFYFNILDRASNIWDKQDHKRIVIETYLKLLKFEGRLDLSKVCFLCQNNILDENFSLSRAFLNAHSFCINKKIINYKKFEDFFKTGSSILFDDDEVGFMYQIVQEGF